MHLIHEAAQAVQPEHLPATVKTTTLYHLIEAVSEEVNPGEEGLVADVVLHLFTTGRAKFSDASH